MHQQTIGIGGAHSGAGKTALMCALLRMLPGWGAIKCEPTDLYTSVVSDMDVLSEPGKDTALYLGAGAARARWLRSPRHEMGEALSIALSDMDGLAGVLVEGNSAIEVLKPDIVIFISGDPARAKPGADRVMACAQMVVYGIAGGPPEHPPEGAPVIGFSDTAGMREALAALVRKADNARHPEKGT